MRSFLSKCMAFIFGDFGPLSMSFGMALGVIVGLTPLLSLHNIIVLFLVLVTRVNIIAFAAAFAVCSTLAIFFDPWFHSIGQSILTAPNLQTFWTDLYNINFFRLTRFNNTVVMGSLAVSLALFLPVLIIGYFFMKKFGALLCGWASKISFLKTSTA